MANKVIGRWVTSPSGITTFTPETDHGGPLDLWHCGTMVEHEGPHERVFTESEVRAMFIALSQKPGVSWQALLKVAEEHNVVLDAT